jgi:hypothetical protein
MVPMREIADNCLSYLQFRAREGGAMNDGKLYYCWSCDAHRRPVPPALGETKCPRCGELLTREVELTLRRTANPLRPDRTGTFVADRWQEAA